MPAIATLTMNPALDLSTETSRVEPTHKLRCGSPRFDPGGGGINAARVVHELGGDVVAIYPAGGPFGEMLRRSLDAMGLAQHVVPISGSTRESVTVDERATGKQYRFVLPGPTLSTAEQRQCLNVVARLDPPPKYLIVGGGFPPGLDAGFATEIAEIARRIGARLILDISQSMRDAPARGVFLMKPSLRELRDMVGATVESRRDQIAAARSLVRAGRAEVVVVSLGGGGALLVTDTVADHLPAPKVEPRSAVGAGDSMVGAIAFALSRGWRLGDAVRYGVAAGAATVMTPGTELCHRKDVERLFRGMEGGTKKRAGLSTSRARDRAET
jgi:6-phosphofructokinase 2